MQEVWKQLIVLVKSLIKLKVIYYIKEHSNLFTSVLLWQLFSYKIMLQNNGAQIMTVKMEKIIARYFDGTQSSNWSSETNSLLQRNRNIFDLGHDNAANQLSPT